MKVTNKTKNKPVFVVFKKDIPASFYDARKIYIKIAENEDIFSVRRKVRQVINLANQYKVETLSVSTRTLPSALGRTVKERLSNFVFESYLADYRFDKYKTKSKEDDFKIKELVFPNIDNKELAELQKVAQEVEFINKIRDIENTPAEFMKPENFVLQAKKLISGLKIKAQVLNKAQIKKEKMEAFLAVAQGASSEPKFLTLTYEGAKKTDPFTVLVGKGVTYDTGGLGLKPAEYMLGMHMDMSGAAVSLGVIALLAKRKVKRNVVVFIPLAENALGPSSYRQGDIVRAKNGTFIEIRHTDAEGRLLLADALCYAQEKVKKIDKIIDVATLTGAAMVALGNYTTAVFTNNEKSLLPFERVQQKVGQRIWHMPILPEHREDVKSKIADIVNSTQTRYGGACTAAAFLEHFIKKENTWLHFDIAPRMEATQYDLLAVGATGEPVALLTEALSE